MRRFRRKPWRKYSRASVYSLSHYIRYICCVILVWEMAFFARESLGAGGGLYRMSSILETESAAGEEDVKKAPDRTYGIRFRLEDGEIDVYRKEKLKSTN